MLRFTCMPLCSSLRVLSHSGPWVPAGTRSSLRPLHRGGSRKQQNSGAKCRENADLCVIEPKKMVLPDRIELSTSPLPMECSTTELRQHVLGQESAARGAYQAGRYLPQAPLLCKLASPVKTRKSGRYRGQNARFRSKRRTFPRFVGRCPRPTGQLARGADSIHFEFRTIGSRPAS